MNKFLYVILDSVNNEFGEVLSFNNFEEAKRAFAWSVHLTPVPFRKDLELHEVGCISNEIPRSLEENEDGHMVETVIDYIDPVVYQHKDDISDMDFILSSNPEILEMVKKYDDDEAEKNVFMQQLAKNCKDVFSAQDFVNNVSKLSRFMSKDKRFKRL